MEQRGKNLTQSETEPSGTIENILKPCVLQVTAVDDDVCMSVFA